MHLFVARPLDVRTARAAAGRPSLKCTALAAAAVATAIVLSTAHAARADVSGDLTLEIAATPDPARNNERITVELVACNGGAAELTGVTITHVVPTGVTFTVRTDGGTCTTAACGAGATVTFALGALGANSCRMVGMSPLVTATDGQQIVFTAEVDADGGATVGDSLTVNVAGTPALAVEIDDSSDPVAGGDVLSYTVAFANRTTTNVLGAQLSVPVPAGTTVASIDDGGVESGGEITWTLGTLSAGVSGRRRFSVTVDEAAIDGSAVVASAEVTGNAGQSARATQITAVESAETLSVHLTASPDSVATNARIIYDITACNAGALEATGVVADILIPNGVTFTVRTDGATCTTAACGVAAVAEWDLGTLGAGQCRTVQSSPLVTAAADGELIRHTVRLHADGEALTTATRTVVQKATPELVLALTEDREPVGAGESLTYTLTYGVPTASANVLDTTLRAWVPPGTVVDTISGGGTEAGGVITWDLSTLRSGESGQRQFTVTIDGDAADGIALAAEAELDAGTTFGAGASQATAVNAAETLSVSMTAVPDPARSNERVVYDVTACNAGLNEATGVFLNVLIPNLVTFTAGVDGSVCTTAACGAASIRSWDLGALAGGRCRTVQFDPIVTGTLSGQIIPTEVRLNADGGAMAVAARTIVVDLAPSLSLVLYENAEPAQAGGTIVYTLTASNVTTENVASTSLRFAIPASATVADISDDGVEADGNVTWALGTFAAGTSVQRRVSVTLDEALPDGSAVIAESELTGGATEKFGARSVQATAVVSSEALRVRLLASPDPARNAERITYEITVCNSSALDVTGVILDGWIPNGVTFSVRTDGGTCSTAACGVAGFVEWDLDVLAAGRCRTVGLFPQVTAAVQGTAIPLSVRVRGDGGAIALAGRTVVMDDQDLTTAVVEEIDPAAPGSVLNYAVTFGNRGDTTVTNGEVRIALPAGTTLLSGGNGALVDGGEIAWNLCPLGTGQSGTLNFSVTLDETATLPDGSLLASDAQVSGDVGAPPRSRADAFTGVLANSPLRLDLTSDVTLAGASDLVTFDLTACNDSVDQATGVIVRMFAPRGTAVSSIQDGGAQISTTEIEWSLDTVDAGTCETVSLVVAVSATPSLDGTVVFASARMLADGGDTAVAHSSLRLCDGTTAACTVKPPLPCGAPASRACNRTASDALTILRAAVNLLTCPLCECDIDNSTSITASDALGLLRFSVGNFVALRCPPCTG